MDQIGEVLDAGPVLYLYSRTEDMRAKLKRRFRGNWKKLYCMAMLRAIHHCPLAEMEHAFRRSLLRAIYPDVSIDRQTIVQMLGDREAVQPFDYPYMAHETEESTLYLMLDGNRMLRDMGDLIPDTAGHPGKAYHLDQLNVLYAFSASDDGATGMPLYFGQNSSNDYSLKDLDGECDNMRMAKCLIGIGGREAAGDAFRTRLEQMGIPYIVRLKRGSDAAKEPLLDNIEEYSESFKAGDRKVYFHSVRKGEHCTTAYLDLLTWLSDRGLGMRRDIMREMGDDVLQREFFVRHPLMSHGLDGSGSLEQVSEEELMSGGEKAYGTITLQTYGLKLNEKKVYRLYQLRQQMEQMFQPYDVLLPQDDAYLGEKFVENSWLFLNHLATQMAADTWNHIRKVRRAKPITPQALYGRLSAIHCLNLNGKWTVPTIAEDLDAMCRKFGFDPTDLAAVGVQ